MQLRTEATMDMKVSKDPSRMMSNISIGFDELSLMRFHDRIYEMACHRIAEAVAAAYLAEHMQEVLAKIDAQALANLAVADAAGAIREQLAKKLPDKIMEVVRTEVEVYQRGIFGGMKRIR